MDIEGLSLEEALALSEADLDSLVFIGRPIVFSIGSAKILGEFRRDIRSLTIELAQIDGGGEGVLAALARLVRALAIRFEVEEVQWIVHAVTCAEPNLKLRRVLDARGFEVREVAGSGVAYHRLDRM